MQISTTSVLFVATTLGAIFGAVSWWPVWSLVTLFLFLANLVVVIGEEN